MNNAIQLDSFVIILSLVFLLNRVPIVATSYYTAVDLRVRLV